MLKSFILAHLSSTLIIMFIVWFVITMVIFVKAMKFVASPHFSFNLSVDLGMLPVSPSNVIINAWHITKCFSIIIAIAMIICFLLAIIL